MDYCCFMVGSIRAYHAASGLEHGGQSYAPSLVANRLGEACHPDRQAEIRGKRSQKRVERATAKCQQSTSGFRSRHHRHKIYYTLLNIKAYQHSHRNPQQTPYINAGNPPATPAKQCMQSHEERCAVSLAGRANACPSSTRTFKRSNTPVPPPRRMTADQVKGWWMD